MGTQAPPPSINDQNEYVSSQINHGISRESNDQPAKQQQLVSVEINVDKNEPLDDHELTINNNTTSAMVSGRISSIFKENDIGKTAMGYVPSAIVALLINTTAFPGFASHVVLIVFSVGFALIWNGIMLRNLFQRFGRVAEQAGVVMVFLGFFGLVASVLPLALVWAPLLCGVLFLLPFILRVLPASHCNLLLRTINKRIGTTSGRPPLLPISNELVRRKSDP